jgi:hypothetical protein
VAANLFYKVAYEEAVRTLAEQQATIESFRMRAGTLFSAAAVTTSFLGAQALAGGNSSIFLWPALLAFVAVSAVSLASLWPRSWEFTASPLGVIESCAGVAESIEIEELYRALSIDMYGSYLENQLGMKQLAVFFQAAAGLLTIEVVLWIVAIALSL